MYLEPKWCPLFCTWSLGLVLEGFFQPKNREFKPNRFQIPVFYKKIAAGWLHQFPFAGIEQTFAGPHSRGQVDASVYNTFGGVFIIYCRDGGFQHFLFSSLFGKDSHFDSYFSTGLKPPTSCNTDFGGFIIILLFYTTVKKQK